MSLLFLAGQGALFAFSFSPITQEFSVTGKKSSHIFTIGNDSLSERIAVKISIFEREMDEEGNETLTPCDGDFLIYPSQSILAPGESRSVRVKWQGGRIGDRELNYRILAEQLPVEFREDEKHEDGGGIRFTYRYEGSLYVVPEGGGEAHVELSSVRSVMDIKEVTNVVTKTELSEETGEPVTREVKEVSEVRTYRLKLVFENHGARHALLGDLSITLSSVYNNFSPIVLGPEDLAGIAGENILAGNKRVFMIPEPPEVQGEPIKWDFSYNPVY